MGCGASSAATPSDEKRTVTIVEPKKSGDAYRTPTGTPRKLEAGFTKRRLSAAVNIMRAVRGTGEEDLTEMSEKTRISRTSYRKIQAVDIDRLRDEFVKHDTNDTGSLSKTELQNMLEEILGEDIRTALDAEGQPVIEGLMCALDADGSGDVDMDELIAAWRAWFGPAVNPVRCLIIVDVQNDFISGTLSIGACPAGQDGGAVVPVINSMRQKHDWDAVAISMDWHPQDHCSFAECFAADSSSGTKAFPLHESQDPAAAVGPTPFSSLTLLSPDEKTPMPQTLWPRHCVQDTWGSECHADLVRDEKDFIVYKGTNARVDSYSAFCTRNLCMHAHALSCTFFILSLADPHAHPKPQTTTKS